jgi:hypothetical protein
MLAVGAPASRDPQPLAIAISPTVRLPNNALLTEREMMQVFTRASLLRQDFDGLLGHHIEASMITGLCSGRNACFARVT